MIVATGKDVVLNKINLLQVPGIHGTQRRKSQYVSNRKLSFVLFQTPRAKFHPKMSLTLQNKSDWQQRFRKRYTTVGGEHWQAIYHHPSRYFDVWNVHYPGWGNGCSHPAFQKNGWKHMLFTCYDENQLLCKKFSITAGITKIRQDGIPKVYKLALTNLYSVREITSNCCFSRRELIILFSPENRMTFYSCDFM